MIRRYSVTHWATIGIETCSIPQCDYRRRPQKVLTMFVLIRPGFWTVIALCIRLKGRDLPDLVGFSTVFDDGIVALWFFYKSQSQLNYMFCDDVVRYPMMMKSKKSIFILWRRPLKGSLWYCFEFNLFDNWLLQRLLLLLTDLIYYFRHWQSFNIFECCWLTWVCWSQLIFSDG